MSESLEELRKRYKYHPEQHPMKEIPEASSIQDYSISINLLIHIKYYPVPQCAAVICTHTAMLLRSVIFLLLNATLYKDPAPSIPHSQAGSCFQFSNGQSGQREPRTNPSSPTLRSFQCVRVCCMYFYRNIQRGNTDPCRYEYKVMVSLKISQIYCCFCNLILPSQAILRESIGKSPRCLVIKCFNTLKSLILN